MSKFVEIVEAVPDGLWWTAPPDPAWGEPRMKKVYDHLESLGIPKRIFTGSEEFAKSFEFMKMDREQIRRNQDWMKKVYDEWVKSCFARQADQADTPVIVEENK